MQPFMRSDVILGAVQVNVLQPSKPDIIPETVPQDDSFSTSKQNELSRVFPGVVSTVHATVWATLIHTH